MVGEGGAIARIEAGPAPRCAGVLEVPGADAADVDRSGDLVLVGTDEEVVALDAAGGERWRTPHPGRLLDVSVSADGCWVAAGFGDHLARPWAADTGLRRAILPGHKERISGVDFSPDGALLATATWDGSARLWRLDVFDRDAASLDRDAEARFGLTLAQALDASRR